MIAIALAVFLLPEQRSTVGPLFPTDSIDLVDSKALAFAILDNKCNSCHRIKNKRRIFTIENMDGNAKKIHKQVFIWKRMPKRSAPQLTTIEYDQLKNWLTSQTTK